jgi:hypothetical protein
MTPAESIDWCSIRSVSIRGSRRPLREEEHVEKHPVVRRRLLLGRRGGSHSYGGETVIDELNTTTAPQERAYASPIWYTPR